MNDVRHTLLAGGALLFATLTAQAAGTLHSAAVTRVYNKVDILAPERPAVPARVGDGISGKTAVQTGNQARAELEFNDQTIARLGANSVFSFEKGTRDLNLDEGAILLEVPKNAGGATINTAAVTAAVTGTTVMIETRKTGGPKSKGLVKFIVLEGTMRLKLKGRPGESVLMTAGQILTVSPGDLVLPEPQIVDVARLTKTSGLMSKQFSELKNQPFIFQTEKTQHLLKTKGKLITVNYGLYGKKKNPGLQLVNTSALASLRTDADGVSSPPAKPPKKTATVRPPKVIVNNPKPKPPKPPVVVKPPKPPSQPKPPKRPRPPAPPPVPPAPPLD
ncbi:MAG TPA: FecR family protein [Chthoniobacterales bacterium]|jgi:hypothetical protein